MTIQWLWWMFYFCLAPKPVITYPAAAARPNPNRTWKQRGKARKAAGNKLKPAESNAKNKQSQPRGQQVPGKHHTICSAWLGAVWFFF